MPIAFTLNGEPHTSAEGQTILGLLRELDLDPSRVAIELNRRILKQPLWAETPLHSGAEIEIVRFVGGG
ncbi:MAG: sulfur carrier protein ThiS [Acidobacteriia bacterium]|nr:sulfur carrier protein ThiS [Terriglobia bacterium]